MFYFVPSETSENHTVFKSFQGFKNETLTHSGLRLICLYKYKSVVEVKQWYWQTQASYMNFLNTQQAFKIMAVQFNNMHMHSQCHHTTLIALEWKGEMILVKYMKVYIRWSMHLLSSVF